MKLVWFVFSSVLLFQIETTAAELLFKSGNKQVSLIELYSSEGCSSCPPADRWVEKLTQQERLWKEFVPLNFHVDYWNRLGWVDRFSHKAFTRRQRSFAAEWKSSRVYTPGFVKNGNEWRNWHTNKLGKLLGPEVGELKVFKISADKVKIQYVPKNKTPQKIKVHLALLGHGLSTKVKTGENAGETLNHEFVVLKHNEKNVEQKNGIYETEMNIPKNKKAGAKSFSIAVWVSKKGSQKPIQAAGGYLASK